MSDIIFLNLFGLFTKIIFKSKWIAMLEYIYFSYLCDILFILFSYYHTWLSSLVFSSLPCKTYVYAFGHFGNNEVQGCQKYDLREVTSGIIRNSQVPGQCPKISKYFSGIWAESYNFELFFIRCRGESYNFILFFAWRSGKAKRYLGRPSPGYGSRNSINVPNYTNNEFYTKLKHIQILS